MTATSVEDLCAPDCWACSQEAATRIASAAGSALDQSTDELLTNHASQSGRWLRFCADVESHEDFNEFLADARIETSRAMGGDGAPADPDAGASLEAA